MKVRIEAGDGRSNRFHIFDVETGKKVGCVTAVDFHADLSGDRIQLTIMDYETGIATISPWLVGKTSEDRSKHWFEG